MLNCPSEMEKPLLYPCNPTNTNSKILLFKTTKQAPKEVTYVKPQVTKSRLTVSAFSEMASKTNQKLPEQH